MPPPFGILGGIFRCGAQKYLEWRSGGRTEWDVEMVRRSSVRFHTLCNPTSHTAGDRWRYGTNAPGLPACLLAWGHFAEEKKKRRRYNPGSPFKLLNTGKSRSNAYFQYELYCYTISVAQRHLSGVGFGGAVQVGELGLTDISIYSTNLALTVLAARSNVFWPFTTHSVTHARLSHSSRTIPNGLTQQTHLDHGNMDTLARLLPAAAAAAPRHCFRIDTNSGPDDAARVFFASAPRAPPPPPPPSPRERHSCRIYGGRGPFFAVICHTTNRSSASFLIAVMHTFKNYFPITD